MRTLVRRSIDGSGGCRSSGRARPSSPQPRRSCGAGARRTRRFGHGSSWPCSQSPPRGPWSRPCWARHDGCPRRRTYLCAQAVLAAHLVVWRPEQAGAMPAFDNTAAVAVGLSFLVLPRMAGLLYVALTQVLYVVLLPRALGAVWTAWIIMTTVIAALVCLVARLVIDESLARMRTSRDLAAEAEGLEDETTVRSHALNGWLDLVHREIIGALQPASADVGDIGPATALIRARAANALTSLTTFRLPESEESFERLIGRTAKALGLRVTMVQDGQWGDAGPQAALRSCVSEALTNVQRHAGTRSAAVTATFVPDRWVVTITDSGRGFSVDDTGPTRSHGLDVSLRSPWTAAGGTVVIDAAPGRGTMIRLVWDGAPASLRTWAPSSVRWLAPWSFCPCCCIRSWAGCRRIPQPHCPDRRAGGDRRGHRPGLLRPSVGLLRADAPVPVPGAAGRQHRPDAGC